MPTYEQEILAAARAVARLQTQRRKLRRQLKKVDQDLKHERKLLKAIMNRNEERRPDIVPSRTYGAGVGYRARNLKAAPAAEPDTPLVPLLGDED